MKVNDWLSAMTNYKSAEYTFTQPDWYFFLVDGHNLFSGIFYKYLPDPAFVTAYDNANLERELSINDVAVFLKKKLDGGSKDRNGSIRILLSKVDNLLNFFAAQQKNPNWLDHITMRNILNSNPELIIQAQTYYYTRVTYWLKQANLPKNN